MIKQSKILTKRTKRTKRLVPILLLASLAVACTASIKPALKSSVDTQLGAIAESSATIEASTPLGYQAGQWLKYRIVNEKGEPTIATYKLLASDGATHSIEAKIESYYVEQTSYMEIRYAIGAPLDSLQILRVISSSDTRPSPEEASPFELSIMRSMLHILATRFFVQTNAPMQADEMQVTAGVFRGTWEQDVELYWGPLSTSSHSWHHPAVPMHGMIKAERTDGTPTTTELIAYGESGAMSELLVFR